jgi:hypothetical protein
MVTSTFKAINVWQLLFSSSCHILKLSWKGPGIIGHYDEAEIFHLPSHMGSM